MSASIGVSASGSRLASSASSFSDGGAEELPLLHALGASSALARAQPALPTLIAFFEIFQEFGCPLEYLALYASESSDM